MQYKKALFLVRIEDMAMAQVLIPQPALLRLGDIPRLSQRSDSESDGGYVSPTESAECRSTSPVIVLSRHVECADNSPVEVSAELQEKVMRQVEWYFSDENLMRDSFLMKHISRNKQGYVSLKLVASLRKVKAITKDWKVVLESVNKSSLLQVNEEGTKVKRISAAPQVDYSHLSKTLLVTNYPHSNPNEEALEREFGSYGRLSRVIVLHPGKAIPLDIKSCRSKFPCIGKEICIIVECDSESVAHKICQELSKQQNWRQTMSIQILASGDSSAAVKNAEPSKKQKTKKGTEKKTLSTMDAPKSSPMGYRNRQKGCDSGYSRSPSLSPVPTRRAMPEMQTLTPSRLLKATRHLGPSVIVLRSPRGPDGTKGFPKH